MKYFKLGKMKRLIILGVTIVSAILVIALGGSLYVSKNSKKSIEYGGGAEYVVKVTPEGRGASISDEVATEVAKAIYGRIDSLGIGGATASSEKSSDGPKIRVTYPGITSEEQKDSLEKLITEKPTLTFTDIYGNPLFDSHQNFNSILVGNHRSMIDPSSPSQIPLSTNGAREVPKDGEGKYS